MTEPVGSIADDTFEGIAAGEEPCSIEEISPDMICDEQTEKLFNFLPAKDIVNGFADGNEAGSCVDVEQSKSTKIKMEPEDASMHAMDDKANNVAAKFGPNEATSSADAVKESTKALSIENQSSSSSSSSSSSDTDSDSSSSSSTSSSSSSSSSSKTETAKATGHHPCRKSSSPVKGKSEEHKKHQMELSNLYLKYQGKIKPCHVELHRVKVEKSACVRVKQLSTYISREDLVRFNRQRRAKIVKLQQRKEKAKLENKGNKQLTTKDKMKTDAISKSTGANPSFKSAEFLSSDSSSDDEPLNKPVQKGTPAKPPSPQSKHFSTVVSSKAVPSSSSSSEDEVLVREEAPKLEVTAYERKPKENNRSNIIKTEPVEGSKKPDSLQNQLPVEPAAVTTNLITEVTEIQQPTGVTLGNVSKSADGVQLSQPPPSSPKPCVASSSSADANCLPASPLSSQDSLVISEGVSGHVVPDVEPRSLPADQASVLADLEKHCKRCYVKLIDCVNYRQMASISRNSKSAGGQKERNEKKETTKETVSSSYNKRKDTDNEMGTKETVSSSKIRRRDTDNEIATKEMASSSKMKRKETYNDVATNESMSSIKVKSKDVNKEMATKETALSSKKKRKDTDNVDQDKVKDEKNKKSAKELNSEHKQPFLDPWSQAISTFNISKIPKKKRRFPDVKPIVVTTHTPGTSSPSETPTERLIQVQHALKSNLMLSSRLDKQATSDVSKQDKPSVTNNSSHRNQRYSKPYSFDSRPLYNHKPTYRDWIGQSNPYNERPPNPNAIRPHNSKPVNPYDDPNRIVRRNQRRKDFASRTRYTDSDNRSYTNDPPSDTFTGDGDSPTYNQNTRGPRTPDLSRDPLGLTEGIPAKVEDRFSFRRPETHKPEPRFSTGEEMSASLSKISDNAKSTKGFLEEQRFAIAAMTKASAASHDTGVTSHKPLDPFGPVNSGDLFMSMHSPFNAESVAEQDFQVKTSLPTDPTEAYDMNTREQKLAEELAALEAEKQKLREKEEALAVLKVQAEQTNLTNTPKTDIASENNRKVANKKPVITRTGFGSTSAESGSPSVQPALDDTPIPEGGGLLKQSVIDEIARISLEISKQIAVATGVPKSKVSKGKNEKDQPKETKEAIFERRKAKIKELVSTEGPQPVPPPPSHSPPPLPPSANVPPLPFTPLPAEPPPLPISSTVEENMQEQQSPPPLPLSPPKASPPWTLHEQSTSRRVERMARHIDRPTGRYEDDVDYRSSLNRDRYSPEYRNAERRHTRNWSPTHEPRQHTFPPPAKASFKPLAPPPLPPRPFLPNATHSGPWPMSVQRSIPMDRNVTVMAPPSIVMDPPLSEEELAMQAMGLPVQFSRKPVNRMVSNAAKGCANQDTPEHSSEQDDMEGVEEGEYEEGEIIDTPPSDHHPPAQSKPPKSAARRRFDGFDFANDMMEGPVSRQLIHFSQGANVEEEPTRTFEEWHSLIHATERTGPFPNAEIIPVSSHLRNRNGLSSLPVKQKKVTVPAAMPFTLQQISKISDGINRKSSETSLMVTEYRRHMLAIQKNRSSAEVFNALNKILHIHDTQPKAVINFIHIKDKIPDLSDTFNNALVNILAHHDSRRLVKMAKKAARYSVTVHSDISAIIEEIANGS